MARDRAPAAAASRPELEVAERRLVALAEQLEDADALAEVVVRLGRRARPPRAGGRARAGTLPTCRSSPPAGCATTARRAAAAPRPIRSERQQRLDRDELRLQDVAGRGIGRAGDIARQVERARRHRHAEARAARRARGPTTGTSGWPASRRTPPAPWRATGWRPRAGRESGESAPACRRRRPVVSRMKCSGLRTSSARLSASSARVRLPTRTQICPSEASATPRPCGVPACSCSSTLRSASASACSWRCSISATLAWLPQTVASTSPASTVTASRSACRSAVIASSSRPSCASVIPDSECTIARWRRSPAACSAEAAFEMCSRTIAMSPTWR